MKRMIIFDRDGTLVVDYGYTHKVEDLRWMKGALQLLHELNQMGILVVVATNQSGIGRGYYSQEEVNIFHAQMSHEAKLKGGKIESFYVCPHLPDINGMPVCSCRKPNPGMLINAMKDFNVYSEECIFVGNSRSDFEAANKAEMQFVLVEKELDIDKVLEACKC